MLPVPCATHGKYTHISNLEVLVLSFSISILGSFLLLLLHLTYFWLYFLGTFRFYIQNTREN